MTKEGLEKFFGQVKGKKIKLNYWDNNDYFIPSSLREDIMIGVLFMGYRYRNSVGVYICSGFSKDSYGGYWEFHGEDSCAEILQTDECQHEWVDYAGLFETYKFCKKCDKKLDR